MNLEFLFRNVGNRITPELAQGLAAAIQGLAVEAYKQGCLETAQAAAPRADLPGFDYLQKEVIGEYTLHPAKWSCEQERVIPLHREHFAELESQRNVGARFDPRYDYLDSWESQGRLLLVLLEWQGAVVGNIGMVLDRGKTNQLLTAQEQFFFISPAHRKGWMGMRLLRYVEELLIQAGFKEITFFSHPARPADSLYKRAGYLPAGSVYTKVLA